MKYNLQKIMIRAWQIYRKNSGEITFAEALHRSWQSEKSKPENEKRVQDAKAAAGIEEEVNTWAAWRDLGYTVRHGSKALFQTMLIWASKGDGQQYRASFFGASQVEAIAVV